MAFRYIYNRSNHQNFDESSRFSTQSLMSLLYFTVFMDSDHLIWQQVLAVDMPRIIHLGPSLDGEALGQVCIQSDGDSFDYIKDNQQ